MMNRFLTGIVFLWISLTAQPGMAETAIFAGGCFWCMEADFEKLNGVGDVISGFTGGTVKDPTYNGNHEGHYEAVRIPYDPDVITYEQLLDHYWVNIDPFDPGGQFCDRGPSYRAAIFVLNEEQRKLAEASREEVINLFPNSDIVTPILDATTFYPVTDDENYHQDYYKKNSISYKFYRFGCGRDNHLDAIWSEKGKR